MAARRGRGHRAFGAAGGVAPQLPPPLQRRPSTLRSLLERRALDAEAERRRRRRGEQTLLKRAGRLVSESFTRLLFGHPTNHDSTRRGGQRRRLLSPTSSAGGSPSSPFGFDASQGSHQKSGKKRRKRKGGSHGDGSLFSSPSSPLSFGNSNEKEESAALAQRAEAKKRAAATASARIGWGWLLGGCGGSNAYCGPHHLIVNRPRSLADRLLFRRGRQPLLKAWSLFLVCVELLVLFNFAVLGEPANVACAWLTKGYPSGETVVVPAAASLAVVGVSGGGGSSSSAAAATATTAAAYATVPLATPLGNAAFVAQFMCLIIPRALFYLFYENIAIAGFAAFVHIGEIFHFWALGGAQRRAFKAEKQEQLLLSKQQNGGGSGASSAAAASTAASFSWGADQYFVFAFILLNAPLYARHFYHIVNYCCTCGPASRRALLEEQAMGSTDSLDAALRRRDDRRMRLQKAGGQRRSTSAHFLSSTGVATSVLGNGRAAVGHHHSHHSLSSSPHSPSSPPIPPLPAPASPADLYYRDDRPISFKFYKVLRRLRFACHYGVGLVWNVLAALSALWAAYGLCWAFRNISFSNDLGGGGGGGGANDADPYHFRSLATEDATVIAISATIYIAVSSALAALTPFFSRAGNIINWWGAFSSDGRGGGGGGSPMAAPLLRSRFRRESFYDDSEDEEWLLSQPASRRSIVAARLPVALLGICAQLLIALPLRLAAYAEAEAEAEAASLLLADEGERASSGGGSGYYYAQSQQQKQPLLSVSAYAVAVATPSPLLHLILYNTVGLSFSPPPSLLRVLAISAAATYAVGMAMATGAFTVLWVRLLDSIL